MAAMERHERLISAGEALHGRGRWCRPLARALGVNARTIRRWQTGTVAIPARVDEALPRLLREQIAVLHDTLLRIDRALQQAAD